MASKPKINPDGNGFVSMEEFIRTRDSVVTGLTKLNGAISTLISAYVTHTNTLLNSSGQVQAVLDTKELSDYLASAGLASPKVNAAEPSSSKDKKKRPKKERDPNAPKRPLTAFFLFSTRAREHIKSDLGVDATPVEINNEILRRWNDMDAAQKDKWKEIYNQNYEQYKKEVEAYRIQTGQDIPVEPEIHHDTVADPKHLDAAAGAVESEEEDDDESSEDEEVPEPPKAPTPPPKKAKASAKGKKAVVAAAAAAPAVASPSPSAQLQAPRSTVAIPLPTPNEKRKKTKEEPAELPKKKKAKKSDVAAPTPAPAPVATPVTEKKKKKKSKKADAA